MCDHLCILLEDELLELSILKQELEIHVKTFNNLVDLKIQLGSKKCKSIDILKYVDKRSGWSTIFDFCPKCGEKLNWKEIKKHLTSKE